MSTANSQSGRNGKTPKVSTKGQGTNLTLRLPEDEDAAFRKLAKDTGVSPGLLAKRLVRDALAQADHTKAFHQRLADTNSRVDDIYREAKNLKIHMDHFLNQVFPDFKRDVFAALADLMVGKPLTEEQAMEWLRALRAPPESER